MLLCFLPELVPPYVMWVKGSREGAQRSPVPGDLPHTAPSL